MVNLREDAALEEGERQGRGRSRDWGGSGWFRWQRGPGARGWLLPRWVQGTMFLALWLVLSPVDAL